MDELALNIPSSGPFSKERITKNSENLDLQPVPGLWVVRSSAQIGI